MPKDEQMRSLDLDRPSVTPLTRAEPLPDTSHQLPYTAVSPSTSTGFAEAQAYLNAHPHADVNVSDSPAHAPTTVTAATRGPPYHDAARPRADSQHSAAIESLVEALSPTTASGPTRNVPAISPTLEREEEEREHAPGQVLTSSSRRSRDLPAAGAEQQEHNTNAERPVSDATTVYTGLPRKEVGDAEKAQDSAPSDDVSVSEQQHTQQQQQQQQQSGPPMPQPRAFRQYGFFAPELTTGRKIFFKGFIPFLVLITVFIVWGIVVIYWASLSEEHTERLTAYVVNGDPQGQIGQAVTQAIMNSANPGNPRRLGWQERSTADFPNAQSIRDNVAPGEDAWIIVQIMDNATALLQQARAAGDASWNPAAVVTLYYSQARNYQAAGSYILPPTQQIIQQTLAQLNPNLTAAYLQSLGTNTATAITNAINAPSTIANPVSYTVENLRPFSQTFTIATTFVGLIYVLILAFNITMAGFGLRQPFEPYLKLSHLVTLRFAVPIIAYVFMALSFSMLNLPFRATFNALNGNYAQGFFAFYAATLLGMMVLGFLCEAVLSIVGPRFIGFGLVMLIIVNVSVANYPIEVLNVFFRYGYAMPFYNLKQIYIGIIYATGHNIVLLKYFAFLAAWLLVLVPTLVFWFWWEQRNTIKDKRAQLDKQEDRDSKMRAQALQEKQQQQRQQQPQHLPSAHEMQQQRSQGAHAHQRQSSNQHGVIVTPTGWRSSADDYARHPDSEPEEEEEEEYVRAYGTEQSGKRSIQNRSPTPIFGRAE